MSDVLQKIYDAEMNFTLSCFWDGGINWALGDSANGYKAQGNEPTVSEAIEALYKAFEKGR